MSQSLATLVILPLMAACFLYLVVIIPIETFRRRLATVPFKRRLFLALLALAYVPVLVLWVAPIEAVR